MLALMYNHSSGLWCDGMCQLSAGEIQSAAACNNATYPSTICSNTSSQSFHSQHYTLWLGVTPDAGVQRAISYLKPQGMLGSVYLAFSLIHGLSERGSDNGQTALDLITQCSNQSWCNMLRKGATSSGEMWGQPSR